MSIKYNYYEGGSAGGLVGANNNPSLCVNFLTNLSYQAEYVVLHGKRIGSFTSVTVYLYSVDGDNKPDAVLATSQTILGADIPTSATNITFTFSSPYTVTNATQYAIVVTVVGGSNYNCFDWWIQNYGGYRRGVYSSVSGEWTMYSGRSHWFQVWGTIALPEKPSGPTPANKATRIAIDTDTIDWIDGGAGQPNAATAYDVYFGLDEDNLVLVQASQAATEFKIDEIANGSPFDYSQYRAWRIDAINDGGTTTGNTWVFSTGFWLSYPPQRLSNYDNIEDSIWDIDSQAWTDDPDYLVAGGGRYKNQIVVVGHSCIYFGEV